MLCMCLSCYNVINKYIFYVKSKIYSRFCWKFEPKKWHKPASTAMAVTAQPLYNLVVQCIYEQVPKANFISRKITRIDYIQANNKIQYIWFHLSHIWNQMIYDVVAMNVLLLILFAFEIIRFFIYMKSLCVMCISNASCFVLFSMFCHLI